MAATENVEQPQWSVDCCFMVPLTETSRNLNELLVSWLECKRDQTSGKIKRELKMLCKHPQDNCEREMKVLGRRSKGIIASGRAGTRMDWPKQCWQIGTYGKRKQCIQHHQSIHKPAPPDVVSIATSTSSMKKSMGGWSMWGKSGLRFSWRERGPAWLNSLQMKALSNLGLWSQRIKKNLWQGCVVR
jgi:hypothetical protein